MLDSFFPTNISDSLSNIRLEAKDVFLKKGFPTPRDENWRYTNLRGLKEIRFQNHDQIVCLENFERGILLDEKTPVLYIENGIPKDLLNFQKRLPVGINCYKLTDWLKTKEQGFDVAHVIKNSFKKNSISALNYSCLKEGIVFKISKDCNITDPIHIKHLINCNVSTVIPSVVFIIAEKNARATFFESHDGVAPETLLATPETTFIINESAFIRHIKTVNQSSKTYHLGLTNSFQEKGSRLSSTSISYSAQITRHQINANLNGQNIDTEFYGLAVPKSGQLVDHDLTIEHSHPNCRSWEFFRGVLIEKTKSAFRGKIHVHEGAHGTDAKQTNQSLLLSDDADAFSRPQLEIYADDVKCTHGATVGQMDQIALHYLMARGIPRELATSMLVLAFCNEVLEKIDHEPLKEKAIRLVLNRLPSGALLTETV